jgi:hypothetical protein
MKKYCLSALIAVILFLCTSGVQAQTIKEKLNQVELMKQFIGTWKCEFPRGGVQIQDYIPFGSAMVNDIKIIHADTIIFLGKSLWGYDKINDKIVSAEILNDEPLITINTFWFTSKNTMISQPEVSPESGDLLGNRFEFKTPDILTVTTINNNRDIETYTFNRIKK